MEAGARARIDVLEASMADLLHWRETVAARLEALPVETVAERLEKLPVVIAESSSLPSPVDTSDIIAFFPYVVSAFGKHHRVIIGPPNATEHWMTFCGWPFGSSRQAERSTELPLCYKSLCDNCFREERLMAKADSERAVSRVGVVTSLPRHPKG